MDIKEKEKIVKYIEEFVKRDKFRAVNYCYSWDGTCGRYFNGKMPEDYVMEVLMKIYEGKKCYTDSYKTFRGSVYYHLKNRMLTYFHLKKTEVNTGKNSEINFTEADRNYMLNEELYFEGAEIIYGGCEMDELRERIYSNFDAGNESEEMILIEEILKGGKREEIAEALGITADDYTNILKRIKSKLQKRSSLNYLQGN